LTQMNYGDVAVRQPRFQKSTEPVDIQAMGERRPHGSTLGRRIDLLGIDQGVKHHSRSALPRDKVRVPMPVGLEFAALVVCGEAPEVRCIDAARARAEAVVGFPPIQLACETPISLACKAFHGERINGARVPVVRGIPDFRATGGYVHSPRAQWVAVVQMAAETEAGLEAVDNTDEVPRDFGQGSNTFVDWPSLFELLDVPGDLSDVLRAHDARLEKAQVVGLKIVKGGARKIAALLPEGGPRSSSCNRPIIASASVWRLAAALVPPSPSRKLDNTGRAFA
jgi:hypothetical protein